MQTLWKEIPNSQKGSQTTLKVPLFDYSSKIIFSQAWYVCEVKKC